MQITEPDTNTWVHVAVAVIFFPKHPDKVLIAKRAKHQHQGGLWEFPGGKVESGESTSEALKRELNEELGITANIAHMHPMIQIPFHYPDKSVLLDVMKVTDFSGQEHGREGQPLEWVFTKDLSNYAFPAANASILNAIQLPEHYLITGSWSSSNSDTTHFGSLKKRIDDLGIVNGMLQWRQPDLLQKNKPLYREKGKQWLKFCKENNLKLLLNNDVEGVELVGADGVQLPFQAVSRYSTRPVSAEKLLGISCHSPEEIISAQALSPDFLTLSPVNHTASHPDVTPMGWERFKCWSRGAAVPVYALGGMTAMDILQAQSMGAQGVACIGDWWK